MEKQSAVDLFFDYWGSYIKGDHVEKKEKALAVMEEAGYTAHTLEMGEYLNRCLCSANDAVMNGGISALADESNSVMFASFATAFGCEDVSIDDDVIFKLDAILFD